MAYYAALVSLVQLLEDIIHRDRYQNLLLDKQQIASVYENFSLLQTLLDDHSPKDREAADSLERRIRDLAYQAQDIIESHISDSVHQYLSEKNEMPQQLQDIIESEIPNQVHRKDKTHGVKRVLRHLISAFKKALHQLLQPQRREELRLDNVSKKYQDLENVKEEVNSIVELEELKDEVDSIVEEMMRMKKSRTTEDLLLNYYCVDAGTSTQASGTNTMEGFEERLTAIIGELCGGRSNLQVVSIVGMGGIGKTTIARNIFYDKFMTYHFDCRLWVTISQDYHLKKVLLDILDCMKVTIDQSSETIDQSSELAKLGTTIHKHLQGRKYLIIMDDMWDTNVWDYIKSILPDDSNGSRIMITTRLSDLALYVDRFGFHYQMECLNEEQSWNLFREKVFCPPALKDIGRLIVKNCQGLPLAIVVAAGLLAKVNKTRCDWEDIARNVSSAAAENDENFTKILSLSYNHLPHHLKPCLLYVGGFFPEDYEIPISELIKLWIAEGFLKPVESKSLEAVAEEYLEDLVNRNLVLITKKSSNGKIKSCGIHDLLRDLCRKRARDENFLHILDKDSSFPPTVGRNVRRLYIRGDFPSRSQFIEAEDFGQHVRSIISDALSFESLFLVSGFKLLRVLNATKGHVFTFPDKILELFNLRCLVFTQDVPVIPPSISLLQNLQTLIIKPNTKRVQFCSLPSQIREMPSLSHIISKRNLHFKCQFFYERIVGKSSMILENLRTLSRVYNVRFTNEVIGMIPNLQKLKILCFDPGWQKFGLDNLFHLRQLETLSISFRLIGPCEVNSLSYSVRFPLNLIKLSLYGCGIPWERMTAVGLLPNLQVLKLRQYAFAGEKWEPVEGEFRRLKFLLLDNLGLKYWHAEDIHFPTLQRLKINCCEQLQEIPLEIGEISTLELIEVTSSDSAANSALQIQEEQQNMGNDVLQVRVNSVYGY